MDYVLTIIFAVTAATAQPVFDADYVTGFSSQEACEKAGQAIVDNNMKKMDELGKEIRNYNKAITITYTCTGIKK